MNGSEPFMIGEPGEGEFEFGNTFGKAVGDQDHLVILVRRKRLQVGVRSQEVEVFGLGGFEVGPQGSSPDSLARNAGAEPV